ncbi:unnamed protein product [Rotaria sp. Silwood1]|nr:unnamed protein product [Rotaria sp. Silwood1]
MGLKNGKYDFEHGISSQNHDETLPSFSSELNESITTKISRKDLKSLPTFIHRDTLIDTSTTNIDNLSLVWLDTNIHQRPSNIDIEIKLKNLINYVRIFDRVDTSPTLIPHLHNLSQVKYIYIFGKSKSISKAHEEWLRGFNKVKGIYSSSRNLIAQIIQDQN